MKIQFFRESNCEKLGTWGRSNITVAPLLNIPRKGDKVRLENPKGIPTYYQVKDVIWAGAMDVRVMLWEIPGSQDWDHKEY